MRTSAEQCYCLAGRRSARQLTRLYERHFTAVDMTSSQFSILALLLQMPGLTVAALAEQMGMERTTLVRVLKPLRDGGLIMEGGREGRAVAMLVSPAGLDRLKQARPHWDAAQREFEASVGHDMAKLYRDASFSVVDGMSD